MNKFYLPLVFFSLTVQAQSVKAIYSEKEMISKERLDAMPPDVREATLTEMQIPKLFVLTSSGGISYYEREGNVKDFNFEKKSSNTNDDGSTSENSIIVNKKNTPFYYYKELNNDFMLFKLTNIGIDINGKDKLINWNWEITNETKIINGYNCKKAVSQAFAGYFTVWFTEDIPVNAGPEKFDGLPGLILYLNTGAVEFVAEQIEISSEKISIPKPTIPESTVTFSEMIDLVTKKFDQVRNTKPRKQGNTTIKTETY